MTSIAKPRARRAKVKTNANGRKLLEAVQQAVYVATTGDMTGITIREVEIPEPGQYGPKEVKALRKAMGTSQQVFAELLGVSKELAAQWEYGIRQPAPLARRLMDRAKENPSAFVSSLVKRRQIATA